MNKRETHIVQGMTRDLSAHKFSPNMVCDARNIRITPLKNNSTLLAVTNEKGAGRFQVNGSIRGTIIGTAVLNKTLVLFTTTGTPLSDGIDRIYRLDFSDDFKSADSTILFENEAGEESLHFDYEHPLETLPVYENEGIQKVYWVDGKNQPRVINTTEGLQENPDVFNFNRKIEGKHSMEVIKYNTGGEFPAGTVQYCFNYFNKFGQETNIVDVSALYYLSPKDKGLPANAMSTSSFVVGLTGLDLNFEYVRLYSIVRTSENAVPNVRIVGDYKLSPDYPIPALSRVYEDVQIDENDFWIIEGSSYKKKCTVKERFGTPENITIFELGDNEYLYDSLSNKVFVYEANYTELKSFCMSYSDGKFNLPFIGQMSASYLYEGSIDNNTVAAKITIVDNGIIGSTLDASAFLFIGGQKLIADTITNKDSTLFLGNIKQTVPNIGELKVGDTNVKSAIRGKAQSCIFDFFGNEKDIEDNPTLEEYNYVSGKSFYSYPIDNNKSSYDTKSFKARENYRLGVIAQYNTGQWSEAVWIDDLDEQFAPGRMVFYTDNQRENNRHWGASYRKPGFKAVIPQTIVSALKSAGFIRVAPVVVYPNDAERKVLYQGLLSGTVYNIDDRDTNSPFVQADWRFRIGYSEERINGEIQANTWNAAPNYPVASKDGNVLDPDTFIAYYANQYYRDSSILTFHSPDIEEDDNIITGYLENTKLRIVGISTLGFEETQSGNYKTIEPSITADSYIHLSSQGFNNQYSRVFNFQSFQDNDTRNPRTYYRRNARIEDLAFVGFADNAVGEVDETGENNEGRIAAAGDKSRIFRWITYLWHRSGSLNNQSTLSEASIKYGAIRYAVLNKKCVSEFRYARTTFFQTKNSFGPQTIDIDINTPKVFESDQQSAVKIDAYGRTGILYYGNIDKVITPTFKDVLGVTCPVDGSSPANLNSKGYPIEYENVTNYSEGDSGRENHSSGRPSREGGSSTTFMSRHSLSEDSETIATLGAFLYGKDPVLMKYKSTKHLVFGLSASSETLVNSFAAFPQNTFQAFWKNNENITHNDVIGPALSSFTTGTNTLFPTIRNSVLIAELYRDFTSEQLQARFGGTSDDALANNTWIRCGDSVYLENSDITLYYKEGDTFIGRYDCMKTYPFSNEDPNQIVSIYSTELESRVNLDARYDKDRGDTSNVFRNPTNFNLYNHPGYEQTNQYFTHKALDYSRIMLNHPNMLTWSLEKKMGADIDAWTSISLTSTADAQGDLGEITGIETFNDSVYLFQPRGVAQVLFNERVQIPTSDSQPIEITNGLKYGGLRYLSNQIGMTNKWSLQTTPNGIYFIDDEKNTLYRFEGHGFTDLSSKEGFNTWLFDNNSYKVWNPVDYGNFRTFYDKVNKDIYFINKNEALVYSELVGHFISFMDYDALPALVNVNDKLFTFRRDSDNDKEEMWEMFAGDYNMFFDYYKPYWLTFISNSDPTYDKIFNNLSWRTESYCNVTEEFKGILQPMSTFDTLRVWNDHQDSGEVSLYGLGGKPSSIKKKFNVFRALVPRDVNGDWRGKGINRIRNPWTYIQLKTRIPNTDMLIFHDLDVDYFI